MCQNVSEIETKDLMFLTQAEHMYIYNKKAPVIDCNPARTFSRNFILFEKYLSNDLVEDDDDRNILFG